MGPELDAAVSEALKLLSAMVGEYVWFVRRSAYSVLRMDFGSPHLKIREPAHHAPNSTQAVIDALERRMVIPTGKWHLFIEDGDWSVKTRFRSASRSDVSVDMVDAALRQLDGQRLVNVSYVNDGWHFEFDLGGSLDIGRSASPGKLAWTEESEWILFYEDGNNVSLTNAMHLRYESA